jgi:cell division initiation protein
MRITPLDIRKQEFRKAMRGLDAEEVYAFLSTVGDEYEAILNENKALRDRLLELDDKVQEYRTMEKTLRDTLLTAERVTVEAKDNARREANLIVKEAQIEAERALRDIKSQAMKLRQEVSQLRGQRESYLGRIRVIAESLLNFIQNVETDFIEEDEAFQAVLPAEDDQKGAHLADPPAESVDLFEEATDFEDAVDAAGAGASSETEGRVPRPDTAHASSNEEDAPDSAKKRQSPVGGGRQDTPGIPKEMLRHGVAGNRSTGQPEPRYPKDAPIPDRKPTADDSAAARAMAGDGEPAEVGPVSDSEIDHAGQPLRADDDGAQAKKVLKDIDAIIERMAKGQKEMLGSGSSDTAAGATPDASHSRQAPPAGRGPLPPDGMAESSGGAGGDKPHATAVDRGATDGGAWERVPEVAEVATAIETPAEEVEPDPPIQSRDSYTVPAGPEITSEMSLEQIRRDLEMRMAREKKKHR